ncbi:MAG: HsdR family type I site-specific deoxyribonuclease [Patescibacteria group bacterium]|nr:HsdR family type I site-specific deoxyribonuclease [Patescibacteria group bacterium]
MEKKKLILNEKEYVEEPLLRQLERLDWSILRAGEEGKGDPSVTFRESFGDVVMERKLREALLRLNPWLEEDQLAPIVREMTTPNVTGGLIENNRYVLEKLLENTSAENRKTGKPETVRFIDFTNSDTNEFLAVSQFKVNIPGTEKHIIPDITLFVNGLPLVLIECKSAYLPDPMGEAIEQLMRYQNRRGDEPEGNAKLFWYNQLLVATSKQICRYASITGEYEHFIEWKDPYPYTLNDIETEGSDAVTSQHIFVQGVLEKKNLLNLIQSFIIFQDGGKGKIIKVTPRYQQFRTVNKIIERLHSGKTPLQKGGIVWHTQGSGKSLTMMMVVRKMYRDPALTAYKTLFITDRTDLETQLGKTAKGIGYTLKVASNIAKLKEFLSTRTPDLIMGMIHKFQEHDLMQEFPMLNDSEKILVLIDEAHRSQFKLLGANLNKSLPNSVKIAFTGTPIDKTEETFGDYIDKYTIRQAVDDGVTVEIIYEGRTHNANIKDAEAMNRRFEDVFADADEDTQALIQGRYTWKAYLEAEETIKEKAEDMLKHYVSQIFPNGFKAQVVAVSRLAAIKYKQAFDALLADNTWVDAFITSLQSQAGITIDKEQLLRMKVEVIISGGNNDDPSMRPYTNEDEHDKSIASFKLPFGKKNEDGLEGNVGILVVQSMLLTGFDAPIEQVMYLDDVIREHNLLQAIARVNRVEKNKQAGFIVDYVGVANHLRKALSNFKDEDIEETLEVVKDEGRDLDELQFAKSALIDFFHKYDVKNTDDIEVCIDLLADDEVRNDFLAIFRKFSNAMDKALPKPEALKFAKDLKHFGFVAQVARNRYRDEKLNLRDVSKKVRDIIDEYLISMGIDPKIPPTPIFDEKFELKIKEKSPKAKAEELKHAITDYIEKHEDEDPELYGRFSEKLEKMLQQYHENWELLAKELEMLRIEMRQGREGEENYGLDRKKELPFLGLLKKEVYGVKDLAELSPEQKENLVRITKDILERIKADVGMVDFWNNVSAQRRLKGYIASHLLTEFKANETMFNKRLILSQKITELAFHLYGNV